MSKGKKTNEELLEEAIVPEEEQPYEVPENWGWVKIKGIGSVKGGKRLPKGHALIEDHTSYPYLRVSDFKDGTIDESELKYISEETANKISRYVVSDEDVFISIAGTIGKTGIVPKHLSGGNLTENAAKITDIKGTSNTFIHLALNTDELQSQIKQSVVSTSQPKLALFRIEDLKFPLPPINEQKRIAEKVERLLSKIEEAKQLIEEAEETFELRRAAILEKAFRGELTTKWREGNSTIESFDELLEKINSEKERTYLGLLQKANIEGIKKPVRPKKFNNKINQESTKSLPKNWGYCTLGDVIYDFKYGTSEKSDYENKGTPVIRIPNIGEEFINADDLKYLKEISLDSNVSVLGGDILIVRSNGSKDLVGKCSIVQKSEEMFAFASYLIRLRPVVIVPEFILWLLKSDRVKEQFFSKSKSSAGINNINTEELATTIIPLPPIEEQREIVRKLKALLTKEEKTKKMLNMDKQVEALKQSILSKAFRGELGTNDPSEESALEILKEVLKEQVK